MSRRQKIAVAAAMVLVPAALLAPAADRHVRAAGMLLRLIDPKDASPVANYRRHSVAVTQTTFPTELGPVPAKLYTPVGVEHPGTMVVLHGVHRLGIEEPRLV